jgi:hypothetical protein
MLVPLNASDVLATAFLNAVGKQLLLSQEKQDQLKRARDLISSEVRSAVTEDDLKAIEDKPTL